jgi:hypothetical protein
MKKSHLMGQSEMYFITLEFGRMNCGRYLTRLMWPYSFHLLYYTFQTINTIHTVYIVIEIVFSKNLARLMCKTKHSKDKNNDRIDGFV